ncbi:FRG domain-containing protein [Clostridium merdae]|uniref:FRG domain-containing protein n=1 Tax=Clostridium merdae TaxID=1958780 RepID=UPI00117D0101|nr:FRG domain-containing protein [Clostridium merdae]
MNLDYMEIISSYINLIRKEIEGLKLNHSQYFDAGILVAFRGEPSDYGQKKLMPSLFRNLEYLKKEHHLFELLCDFNFVSNNSSNIEKAIEAQHYTAISRMLDISFNSLVALYFACENKANENNNGYIFIFAFPEHYSPHSKYIEDFYTYMLDGRHIPYSKNFKVFSHSYSNDRIKAQKGGFIFFQARIIIQ